MEEIFSTEPESPEPWTSWPLQDVCHRDDEDGMEEKYENLHMEEDSTVWESG